MNIFRNKVQVVALAALLGIAPFSLANTTQAGEYDTQIQSRVEQKLSSNKDFKDVRSTVENGVVTLSGSVNTYREKLDAGKQARKSDKEVKEVRNLIEVSPTVPDAQLQKTLARRIADDRIGYYDEAFNAISVNVHNGVATLSGYAADYPSYNDALALAENTKGVKDVVDNVRVLPLSSFDNSLRFRLYRAIYGNSVLSKYAMNPVRPIRIVVDNGHIALFGKVDSTMDKEIAGIEANRVFGGFSVENHLTTPNQVVDR
jgi:hyperosmotically inducible protein